MTPELLPVGCWSCDLATAETDPVDWLWHGLLAAGNVTLLTGLWKAGKTTLLSLLLARRQHGGSLAGLAVKPGKTVIVTEEHRSLWAERVRRLGLRDGICLFSRPFDSIPRPEEWQALIARILQLRDSDAVDLAVIDPLAPFLQSENSPRAIFQSLLPLAALTRQGMAIWANHHPAREERALGQAARGSGALLGHVDISIEMRHPGGDPFTRRRRLFGFSRHSQTPRKLLIELNPDATDYLCLPDDDDDGFHVRSGGCQSAPIARIIPETRQLRRMHDRCCRTQALCWTGIGRHADDPEGIRCDRGL